MYNNIGFVERYRFGNKSFDDLFARKDNKDPMMVISENSMGKNINAKAIQNKTAADLRCSNNCSWACSNSCISGARS